jgi:outer membrane protein OmpA-like peptidoglycan-associated protein
MRSLLKFGVMLSGVLVLGTGCASHSWVKKIEGRVNQQGSTLNGLGTTVSSMSQRVDGLHGRVDDLDGRVSKLASHHHAGNVVDTIDVRFGFNRADLDDGTMTRLHELAKQMKEDTRLNLEMIGFTDARGARDYNAQLAQKRVDSVRRYLATRGVMPSRMAAVGYGQLNDRNVPEAQKRRVTIHVTTQDAMVMAAPTTLGSGSPDTQKTESQ